MSRCRVYNDPQAGLQTLPVSATWDSPCFLRLVSVELCFALKLKPTLSSTICSVLFRCHLLFVFHSHTILPSVFHFRSAPVSDPPMFFSTSENKEEKRKKNTACDECLLCSCVCKQSQVIRGVYSSWFWQACLGARLCLLLHKADFKYSHFRGAVPQWHEVSRLNRSTAPTVFVAHTVGDSACIPSVLLWQDTASRGLNTNMIISWQSPFICWLLAW